MTALSTSQQAARCFQLRTPSYRALGFTFGIRGTDPDAIEYLETLFEPFRDDVDPETWYSFGSITDGGREQYLLYCDDVLLDTNRRPSVVFQTLLWHINRRVVSDSQDRLLIHASAVSVDSAALLFPAPMESGKSTLAAGLVRAGCAYLTDETVAVDLASGFVEPFPRALSVDPGSWEVLADLRPNVHPRIADYLTRQWQIPVSSIPGGTVAGASPVAHVVLPRYRPEEATRLERIPRAEAVLELAHQSFNFHAHGAVALDLLGRVVRGATCHRLSVSDLDVACKMLLDLAHRSEQGGENRRSRSRVARS